MGKVRKTNQDIYALNKLSNHCSYALVCDGMGGQNGGNVASQLSRDVIIEEISTHLDENMQDNEIQKVMENALKAANDLVHQKALDEPLLAGMGTTAVLAVVKDYSAHIVHVGDSRAYLLSQNSLFQMTKDHSFVEMLVDKGKLTRLQAQHDPRKNQITRAIGVLPEIEVDYSKWHLQDGDKLLLCTDGLTNICPIDIIASILGQYDAIQATQHLIDEANDRGGDDNITVVVTQV